MGNKLYIGNLPYNTSEEAIKTHFETIGKVDKVGIIKDKMTNRSKGFGFVEMETDEEAQKAIESFDGQEFEGRNLRVSEAKPQHPRGFDSGKTRY